MTQILLLFGNSQNNYTNGFIHKETSSVLLEIKKLRQVPKYDDHDCKFSWKVLYIKNQTKHGNVGTRNYDESVYGNSDWPSAVRKDFNS